MHELLPDTWRAEEPKDSCCQSTWGLITDITLWADRYMVRLVEILPTKYPENIPHFIVGAGRTDDAVYRCQAANRQSLGAGPGQQ